MKLLDENKRLFGLVNPVDLVAIALALVIVMVLATVLFGRSPAAPVTSADDATIEIVLYGSTLNADEFQLEEGQEVSRFGGAGVMGTLESFEIKPAQREVFSPEGDPIVTDSKTATDIEMVVRGKGAITETGASIGAERIRQGQAFDVQLPYFQMPVRVVSVKQVD